MKETITKLWNGNISPWSEKLFRSKEAEHLVDLLNKHSVHLKEQLNDVGKETLEKYEDCIGELSQIENEDAFVKGFSLGVKITSEALAK